MAFDLHREEDVKEYLDNLGIEYRFSCYSEKNSEGCHLLGDYLEAVKRDFIKAATVYKLNCDDYQYGKSCNKIGTYSLVGKGGCKQSFATALRYFKKGCDNDCAAACLGAGLVLFSQGSEVAVDEKLAINYFERACKGDNPNACFHASGIFITGRKDKIPKDLSKAYQYALKGCELGHLPSCANLSQMYKRGEGVAKNEELADKYKKMVRDLEEQMKKNFHPITFG